MNNGLYVASVAVSLLVEKKQTLSKLHESVLRVVWADAQNKQEIRAKITKGGPGAYVWKTHVVGSHTLMESESMSRQDVVDRMHGSGEITKVFLDTGLGTRPHSSGDGGGCTLFKKFSPLTFHAQDIEGQLPELEKYMLRHSMETVDDNVSVTLMPHTAVIDVRDMPATDGGGGVSFMQVLKEVQQDMPEVDSGNVLPLFLATPEQMYANWQSDEDFWEWLNGVPPDVEVLSAPRYISADFPPGEEVAYLALTEQGTFVVND